MNLNKLGLVTIGLVIGTAVGAFGYKCLYKAAMDIAFEDELEAIRDEVALDYRRELELKGLPVKYESNNVTENKTVDIKPVNKKDNVIQLHEKTEDEYIEELVGPYSRDQFEEETEVQIISVEAFQHEKEYYDKISITYYAIDDTLTDEDSEIIHDVSYYIGDDAYNNFGYMSDDENVVYIRNNKLHIDYEVIRTMESYKESVLGID